MTKAIRCYVCRGEKHKECNDPFVYRSDIHSGSDGGPTKEVLFLKDCPIEATACFVSNLFIFYKKLVEVE